ncbi:metal-binding protein [Oscillatoria sp. FACHB-1407]|uniref:metal-binding protein n=1 Tax=Oscillatoria sp. FACHB-1407 TaxID=2692847 RepID=UPI0016865641|nr:metal-binding protein [Oscillatoria sp. FACHB-1407]MBD2465799.1 metal-binding protein [Oscillatoria sp. FACHB-1407]
MPSGRTHDRITLWTLPLVGGLTLIATQSSTLTLIICSGYLFGGLMFGPDLDIHSVQFKRWGWFRWIWIPYRGSIKHRSPLSHSPVTGTALRIVYLLTWVGLVSFITLALMNELWQLGWTWGDIAGFLGRSLQQRRVEWLMLVLGLELGALSHYIADGALSTYKRFKTKGWKALQPPPLRPTRKPASKRRTSSKASLTPKRRSKP